jgi:hypothetical protein
MAIVDETFNCTIFGVQQFYTGTGTDAQGRIESFEHRPKYAAWRILGWFVITFATHLMTVSVATGWVVEIEVQAR